jgi:hypothetical protein
MEKNHGGIAENNGKPTAPGFKGEGRSGQAACLAQRARINIPADAYRANMNLPPTFEDFR